MKTSKPSRAANSPARGRQSGAGGRKRKCMAVLIGVLLLCFAVVADEQQKVQSADEIRKQIEQLEQKREELQEKREELERKAEEAERQEERRERFRELQAESRERLQDIQMELKEIAEAGDEENATRRKQFTEMRSYLGAVREICRQIIALEGPSRYEKARELARRREALDTKWWMVVEPHYHFTACIAEMENFAREEGSGQHWEIIKELKALEEEDAPAREQEYRLWQARQKRQARMHKLVDEFWHPPSDNRRR